MAALADVNVLVALLHAAHRHSPAAVAWLDRRSEIGAVAVCRVAQMGALRILTNAAAMRGDVKTPTEFWRGWDRLMDDDRFVFVPEPTGLERRWRQLTTTLARGRMAETDTYLAAFALAGKHAVITFDRGFRRFSELELEIVES